MHSSAEVPPMSTPAVEYVRELPPEEQEAVLLFLLKELIRINGGEGLIPFSFAGEQMGYYVPPKAAEHLFERAGPKLTAERDAEIQRVIDNPGKTFTLEEVLASVREEDAAPERPAGSPEIG
jgi:hypothetical protein